MSDPKKSDQIPSRSEFIEMTEAIKADQIMRDAAPDMLAALWVAYRTWGMDNRFGKVIKDAIAKAKGHPDYFIDWMRVWAYIQEDGLVSETIVVPVYNGIVTEVRVP